MSYLYPPVGSHNGSNSPPGGGYRAERRDMSPARRFVIPSTHTVATATVAVTPQPVEYHRPVYRRPFEEYEMRTPSPRIISRLLPGMRVVAASELTVRGVQAVAVGDLGTVHGPSDDPSLADGVNIQWDRRRDGGSRRINVLPSDVEQVPLSHPQQQQQQQQQQPQQPYRVPVTSSSPAYSPLQGWAPPTRVASPPPAVSPREEKLLVDLQRRVQEAAAAAKGEEERLRRLAQQVRDEEERLVRLRREAEEVALSPRGGSERRLTHPQPAPPPTPPAAAIEPVSAAAGIPAASIMDEDQIVNSLDIRMETSVEKVRPSSPPTPKNFMQQPIEHISKSHGSGTGKPQQRHIHFDSAEPSSAVTRQQSSEELASTLPGGGAELPSSVDPSAPTPPLPPTPSLPALSQPPPEEEAEAAAAAASAAHTAASSSATAQSEKKNEEEEWLDHLQGHWIDTAGNTWVVDEWEAEEVKADGWTRKHVLEPLQDGGIAIDGVRASGKSAQDVKWSNGERWVRHEDPAATTSSVMVAGSTPPITGASHPGDDTPQAVWISRRSSLRFASNTLDTSHRSINLDNTTRSLLSRKGSLGKMLAKLATEQDGAGEEGESGIGEDEIEIDEDAVWWQVPYTDVERVTFVHPHHGDPPGATSSPPIHSVIAFDLSRESDASTVLRCTYDGVEQPPVTRVALERTEHGVFLLFPDEAVGPVPDRVVCLPPENMGNVIAGVISLCEKAGVSHNLRYEYEALANQEAIVERFLKAEGRVPWAFANALLPPDYFLEPTSRAATVAALVVVASCLHEGKGGMCSVM